MTETTTATLAGTTSTTVGTIQSKINEGAYFRSMKHSFKSSFAVLGELMQNSRRAGASFVSFEFQPEKRTLRVEDDGVGIADFSKLVQLCESGWETDIMLADNPFGQGFYAVFFACERVTVRSRGISTSITFEEIANKRAIKVLTDAKAPKKGTYLELVGLDEALLGKLPEYLCKSAREVDHYLLTEKVESLARGFAIDVSVNGKQLARPHAKDNLKGEQTQLGFFSCGHIHDERPVSNMPLTTSLSSTLQGNEVALYLQGLPIQVTSYAKACAVIHLDAQVFAPVLPDRAYIYDSEQKLPMLRDALKKMGADFLARQKAKLSEEEFTLTYWEAAKSLGCMAMFNDIALLPIGALSTLAQISDDHANVYGPSSVKGQFLSLSDLQAGKVVVWRDAPTSVKYDPNDGPILTVMQRQCINSVDTDRLDQDHWIFKHTPTCSDMVARVDYGTLIGEEPFYVADAEMEVKLVDSFTITLTSESDPTWKCQQHIGDGWAIQAIECDDIIVACYLCKESSCPYSPLEAITDFCDEREHYDESWCLREHAAWRSLIRGMKGLTLAESIGSELDRADVIITDAQLGQMLMLSAERPTTYNRLAVVDLEKQEFWDGLAAKVAQNIQLDGFTLKNLFAQAAKSPADSAITAG